LLSLDVTVTPLVFIVAVVFGSMALIFLVAAVEGRADSHTGFWVLVGLLLMLVSLLGLWNARLALLHQTSTLADLWQVFAGSTLCFALGLFAAVNAVWKKRK